MSQDTTTPAATPQPQPITWKWLGNHSLVADHGRRPAILSGRDLREQGPDGRMREFDPSGEAGRLLAAAPQLLAALTEQLKAQQVYDSAVGDFDRFNPSERQEEDWTDEDSEEYERVSSAVSAAARRMERAHVESVAAITAATGSEVTK